MTTAEHTDANTETLTKTDTPAETGGNESLRPRFVPRVDILEGPDHFVLTADVPGASEDGLELTVEKDVLTLWARVPERAFGEKGRDGFAARHAGYPEGDWFRTFRLGDAVDQDKLEAELAGGVLTVTVPKAETRVRRTVEVKAR